MISSAAQGTDKDAACSQVRGGAELIPVSRMGLQAGIDLYAEPARQSLEYLDKLDAYAQQQLRSLCGAPPGM